MRGLRLILAAFALIAAASPPGKPPPAELPESPITEPWVVFFESNGARVTPSAASILDRVVMSWRRYRQGAFDISGHADRAGPSDYNRRLARRRAEAIAAYLVRRGIPRRNVSIHEYGEARPMVETPDNVPEAQNRFVVIASRPPPP